MSRPIVLIAEEFEGTIRKGSLQALGEAKRIAAATGAALRVLAVGEKKDASSADLAANGAAAVEFITADENTMRNSSALAAMSPSVISVRVAFWNPVQTGPRPWPRRWNWITLYGPMPRTA